jgi:hypothetical protein
MEDVFGDVSVLLDGDEDAQWRSADELNDSDDALEYGEILDQGQASDGPKYGLDPVYSLEVQTVQHDCLYEELPSPSIEQKRSSVIWPRG